MKCKAIPLLLIAMLSVSGGKLNAQVLQKQVDGFSLSEDSPDFLSYHFKPASRESTAHFQSVTIHSVPVEFRIPKLMCPEEKAYQITEDGRFRYSYKNEENDKSKSGFRFITMRTFYLETYRKGYLPDSISYKVFVDLSTPEQQELLEVKGSEPCNDYELESGVGLLSYQTTAGGLKLFLTNTDTRMELVKEDTSNEETSIVQVKLLSKAQSVPFNVEALTRPFDSNNISSYAAYLKLVSVLEDAGEKLNSHD